MRKTEIRRKTTETDILIKLELDGAGKVKISSPIGFFNHMLETFARHGRFNLEAKIRGDIEVDQHHMIEDTGYCLGMAFNKALGNKKGINRAGFFIHPMDEALAVAVIDISGRPFLKFSGKFKYEKAGDFKTELVQDFFSGFVNGCQCTIHIKLITGRSDHHKIEAVFKAFARAMDQACQVDKKIKKIPSTKGVI